MSLKQDGSYLAEMLLSKGYKVHGVIRRSSSFNTGRIEHLYTNPVTHTSKDAAFTLHYGDMTGEFLLVFSLFMIALRFFLSDKTNEHHFTGIYSI